MFTIKLYSSDKLQKIPPPLVRDVEWDWGLDNLDEVFQNVCEAFAMTGYIVFWVEGFGESPWRVDVITDLLIIVEQLKEVLTKFDDPQNEHFKLEFYEQGIERTINMQKKDQSIRMKCVSLTKWQPDPIEEVISYVDFDRMMREFVSAFVSFTRNICPQEYADARFQKWLRIESVRRRLALS